MEGVGPWTSCFVERISILILDNATLLSHIESFVYNRLFCLFYAFPACIIDGFLGGLFGFASINTLAWIALERYHVIAKSLTTSPTLSRRRAGVQIILVWIWSAAFSLPPLFGWGAYIPDGFMTYCSFDYLTLSRSNVSFVWTMFFCGFVVPVSVIVVCYAGIARSVRAHARETHMLRAAISREEARTITSKKAKRQEVVIAKISALAVLLFVLSWSPYAVVSLCGILGYQEIITPYVAAIPAMVAKTSAVWNPLLYGLTHTKFRAALGHKLPW